MLEPAIYAGSRGVLPEKHFSRKRDLDIHINVCTKVSANPEKHFSRKRDLDSQLGHNSLSLRTLKSTSLAREI